MLRAPPRFRLFRRFARKAVRDASGATALEFALVATPFFLMILAILELGMVFIVTTSLDNATQEAVRLIRTGEAQSYADCTNTTPHTMTPDDFKRLVCANMGNWLGSQCTTNLSVDVRPSTFTGQTKPDPTTNGVVDPNKLVFSVGTTGQIILARSFYSWKLITPVLYGGLQSYPGTGADMIVSAATFRNEPYAGAAPAAPAPVC